MDFREIESKWQKKWQEMHIFEPVADGDKKFFLTVPYPYMSGSLHIGHGRTFTIGDIIARFKRLDGYNVLFPMAFHVTGTPVLAIADSIKKGDNKVIALYRDYIRIYEKDEEKVERILCSFAKPENIANYFADKAINDFLNMGYSIDWRRKFHTAEPVYNRFVEWQFKKLYDKGVIKKGSYPITYSPEDGNPVGEDDIKDGDTSKVSIMEFTAMKFEFGDSYLVAATLRPETIFGVTNLWVNPSGIYARVRVENEIWIISNDAYEKLKYQKKNVKIIGELKGEELIGQYAEDPVFRRKVIVLPAEFVDTDNATGVVYSVPAHAPYDYQALFDLNNNEKYLKKFAIEPSMIQKIQPIKIIDISGYTMPAQDICNKMGIANQKDPLLEEATQIIYKAEFYDGVLNDKCGQFSGIKISEIKDKVKDWLRNENKADVFYETSRKALTRNGHKVIVAVLQEQWFIDYSSQWWKELGHRATGRMLFYPKKYGEMMQGIIDWLDKRPCARKRGLGTKFPWDKKWMIESLSDSTIYMAFYTIAHIIRSENISDTTLTEELFDYVFMGHGSAKVISKSVNIPEKVIEKMRREFTYWYPNDDRHTSPPHMSNHLAFFIMHHAAIFPEKQWPRAITLNGLMIREGAKISKSKGNVIPLAHISSRYGVDLFRLYCAVAADLDTVMDWKESEVSSLRKRFEKIASLFMESANAKPITKFNHYDRWFLSRFYRRYDESIGLMRNFRIRDAMLNMLFHFVNDVRYYEKHVGEDRCRQAIRIVMEDWLKIISPVVPHMAEEFWHKIGHDNFISLETLGQVKDNFIDFKIESELEYVDAVIADIHEIIEVTKIQPMRIYIYTAEPWKWEIFETLKDASPKDAMRIAMQSKVIKNRGEIAKLVKRILNGKIKYAKVDEERVLEREKEYMEHEVNAEIFINDKYDPKNKRQFAIPLKPAIYVTDSQK